MAQKIMNEDYKYIEVGSVSLYVNRNANIWSTFAMYLSRTLRAVKSNYSDQIPLQVIVVYIIPGFRNPVEFSGTRITIKSRKGIKRVQVEAAVPDIPFPEDTPEQAKQIILDLMLDATKLVEAYAQKNKIISRELEGARNVIADLWKNWNVSKFKYEIPEGLDYYDLPRVINCGSLVTWQLQKGNYYGVCRRLTAGCKLSKMLREDKIEDLLISELGQLVSPNQAVIEWVANKMRKHHKTQIEERETAISQLKTRISRIKNMDEMLYDDKLAGEISKERYEDKHGAFKAELAKLEEQIAGFDSNNDLRLEQALVILQLSQKAAEIYPKKSPEEKRLIISKLFDEVTLDKGVASVKYTKFAEAIADKVLKTRALMEG